MRVEVTPGRINIVPGMPAQITITITNTSTVIGGFDLRILGAHTHATWLGSLVFDGARAFEGVMPDLDRHSARVIRSAEALGLETKMTAEEVEAIARDGLSAFGRDAAVSRFIL